MSTEVETPRTITFSTRAKAAHQQWLPPVSIRDEIITGNSGHGIWWEATSHCEIERVTIMGERQIGVNLVWAMFASLKNVRINGPHHGICVRSGQGVWPDAKHHNSASNLPRHVSCVFFGQNENSQGFLVDGAYQVLYDACYVQGRKCGVGWWIYPRHRGSLTEIVRCGIEVPDGIKTGIEFDSIGSGLVIRGLRFSRDNAPEVLIDMSGADDCCLTLEQNQWDVIPPIKLSQSTRVEFGKGNSFSERQFWKAVEDAK